MSRFFFDTDDGELLLRDPEGQDLPDAEAARQLALTALRDMAVEALPDGDRRVFAVNVRDERDRMIYKAEFELRGQWLRAA